MFVYCHDDVIKWKHFPRYWPFVRGIHRSPVNSPHKGQWRGALMFTLICARINGWVYNREAGDLRRYRPHYDVITCVLISGLKWLLATEFCCFLSSYSDISWAPWRLTLILSQVRHFHGRRVKIDIKNGIQYYRLYQSWKNQHSPIKVL